VIQYARHALTLASLVASLAPAMVRAQSDPVWRSVDYSRQLRDSTAQRISVRYASGRVDVHSSTDPLLYALHLRYDETRSVPLHRYEADRRLVTLGLESRARAASMGGSRGDGGELRLTLPRSVPLDLDLEMGGAEANLELGGLALQSVRLECGATNATLAFTTPTRIAMRELDINVGAASFRALHLANANADQIRVRGGVGSVSLDFGGRWTRDLTVSTRLAVGTLTLLIPDDVGVRLEVDRLAANFEHPGLVKRDDAWFSENWDRAPHKLRIRAETFFGKIDVQHGAP
jgi:hypothetical protein